VCLLNYDSCIIFFVWPKPPWPRLWSACSFRWRRRRRFCCSCNSVSVSWPGSLLFQFVGVFVNDFFLSFFGFWPSPSLTALDAPESSSVAPQTRRGNVSLLLLQTVPKKSKSKLKLKFKTH